MDLDTILPVLGEYGRYQKRLLWCIFLPCVLPCAFHAYGQIFMSATPKYHCKDRDDDKYMWDNSTGCCEFGVYYDNSLYKNTVVSEWNLICDKDYYSTLALVLFSISGLFGQYFFGILQDRIGRKPSFFLYLLIECVFGTATIFAWNFSSWLIFRIGVGFTIPAILSSPFLLPIELVGAKYRTRCTLWNNLAYSFGLVILGIFAYFIRDWRLLAAATTLPIIPFFLYWSCMPESPRWLLAVGRYKDALKVLQQMAVVNGKILSQNYFNDLLKTQEQQLEMSQIVEDVNYGLKDLFKYSNLRRKTIILSLLWFTNTSVYVGLSYCAPILNGSSHINFLLAGAAELPTYVILWPAMEMFGRRCIIYTSMLIGGVACVLAIFPIFGDNLKLLFYCIGKMGVSSSYVALPLFASELYPTVVRGLAMGLNCSVGMLGPVIAPLITFTVFQSEFPLFIMGVLMLGGGISSMFLPETKDKPLLQTIEDGEVNVQRIPLSQ